MASPKGSGDDLDGETMIFTQEIQVRDFTKRGKVIGLEYDFDLPYPDGHPPKRIRRKSPFVPGPTLTVERATKQTKEWAAALRLKLWNNGIRPKSRREVREELARQTSAPKVPTLKEFAPRWVEAALGPEPLSQGTLDIRHRALELHLLPVLGHLTLDKIGPEQYQLLKAHLKTKPNGSLRGGQHTNEVLGQLYRMLKDAHEWEILLRLPKPPEYVPEVEPEVSFYVEEQYRALLLEAEKYHWQIHLAVLFAGDAGLRVGELVGIRWQDIDLKTGWMTIRKQETEKKEEKKPKSKKTRRVPISPRLTTALLPRRQLSGRVILCTDGSSPTRVDLRRWLRVVEEKAELPEKSIHKLRHTFATRYLSSGGTMRELQQLLGHSSIVTTERYAHVQEKQIEQVMAHLGDRQETKG